MFHLEVYLLVFKIPVTSTAKYQEDFKMLLILID